MRKKTCYKHLTKDKFVICINMIVRGQQPGFSFFSNGNAAGSSRITTPPATWQQSILHQHSHPRSPASRDDAVSLRQRHVSHRRQGTQSASWTAAFRVTQRSSSLQSWCVCNYKNNSESDIPAAYLNDQEGSSPPVEQPFVLWSVFLKYVGFAECLITVISWSWLINVETYISHTFLFVSLQGCGKSVIAKEFAEMLGYSIEPIMLYQVPFTYSTRTVIVKSCMVLWMHNP